MSLKEWFAGSTIVIATRHRKEEVIGPILVQNLGCHCLVPADLDTDRLGTFSGEVPRKYSALDAARKKCLMALADVEGDYCIASEGSFGPHPSIPFSHVHEELILLMHTRTGFELSASKISFETNFAGQFVSSTDELRVFSQKALFPSHGLIIRKSPQSTAGIVKGIQTWTALESAFHTTFDDWGQVYVETDMRAMHNPLRMETIGAATLRLIVKLANQCPNCGTPGFEEVRPISGLPCCYCRQATKSPMAGAYRCHRCCFEADLPITGEKACEDPMYCDYCNP